MAADAASLPEAVAPILLQHPQGGKAGSTSPVRWWKRIAHWPPLWALLILLALPLAWSGYLLLPPTESQTVRDQLPPTIDIAVDKPDIQLLAVIDGSQASGGTMSLTLYANSGPGGFHWLAASSGILAANAGPWTQDVTGSAPANTGTYTLLTDPLETPELQAALRAGNYKPTAQLTVNEAISDYSLTGVSFQIMLPTIEFQGGETNPNSPTGRWYPRLARSPCSRRMRRRPIKPTSPIPPSHHPAFGLAHQSSTRPTGQA